VRLGAPGMAARHTSSDRFSIKNAVTRQLVCHVARMASFLSYAVMGDLSR
jgi:hypothetical protein